MRTVCAALALTLAGLAPPARAQAPRLEAASTQPPSTTGAPAPKAGDQASDKASDKASADGKSVQAAAPEGDDYRVDVRASTYAQLSRQALVPGANGVLVEPRFVATLYGYAFLRVSQVDLPWAKDALSAELSAWGALGALPNPQGQLGDGDLQSAWVQHATSRFRVKLGRQVTLPGAGRYVRFDGVDAGLRLGPVDLSAYAGLVTLPRFVGPRGYFVLGSVNDVLKDPGFLDAQARPGQWLAGARVAWVGTRWLRAALAFHEQQGAQGLAFRNLSADAHATVSGAVGVGGRVVFDLAATRPAEARLFVDVTALERLPISVDYSYAAPSLLLPHTSVLAAFGGASWHELGAEATLRATPYLRVTGRLAGQLYEREVPGFRGALRAQWTPDVDERWMLLAEYARVSAYDNGYHHARAAARWRATQRLYASADLGAYVYDLLVRGARSSLIAVGNVEFRALPQLSLMLSGSLTNSPFAALEGQVLGRLVFELDAPSAGGGS